MGGNAEKTKFSIRVDTDLVELADTYIRSSTVKNRTELIEDALRFYLGFLTAQKAEDYLLQSLSSVMTGTVQDSENRLARMDFKIAVELSKLSQVIAYSHDIDEDALKRLHLKCLEEVRRINGAIDFESAYKYQKRKT
ncbi:ribbon-helix-helix domain-containing protein [Pilosibacter fragilis]|jgi:metal-responsive CopG/Arc/MetJ family transcriptional regulator|uniref:ribbon-helix-helix domain-containing protein n=1 Tax=Pilosibacter fragilis TaxID=3078042 RepID=UPI0031BB7F77